MFRIIMRHLRHVRYPNQIDIWADMRLLLKTLCGYYAPIVIFKKAVSDDVAQNRVCMNGDEQK